jgi:hypothetical protein
MLPTGTRRRPDAVLAGFGFLSRSSAPDAAITADSTLGPNAFSRTVSGELAEDSRPSAMTSEGARNNNRTARQQNALRERNRRSPRREFMPTSYR